MRCGSAGDWDEEEYKNASVGKGCMIQVRSINSSGDGILREYGDRVSSDERKRAVRFGPMLENILGRMDKVVMIRAGIAAKSMQKKITCYLGRTKKQLSGKGIQDENFDPEKIKRGSFIYFNKGGTPVLCMCISNLNKTTKDIVLLSMKKEKKIIEVDKENSCITDTISRQDDILTEKSPGQFRLIDWSHKNLTTNRIMILKQGGKSQPIQCIQVIKTVHPERLESDVDEDVIYSIPSAIIKCVMHEFQVSCVTLTENNTKLIQEAPMPNSIPLGLEYETPLTYSDNSLRSRRDVDACPCTFVAMFQYEASGHDTKTSIKRYFCNAFSQENEIIHWKIFCGRYFYFQDEDPEEFKATEEMAQAGDAAQTPTEGDGGGSEHSPNDTFSLYEEGSSRSQSIEYDRSLSIDSDYTTTPPPSSTQRSESNQSEVSGVSENSALLQRSGSTSSQASRISQLSRKAVYNDVLLPGTDKQEMLSSTELLVFSGQHYRIYINIFIIFHHWARHDHHKPEADKALWDPDKSHTGFDVFYPAKSGQTHLKPWMFTVTQALRNWIIDTAKIHLTAGSIDLSSETKFKHSIETAQNRINTMLKETDFNFSGIDNVKSTIDPIFAAQDWKKDNYKDLIERARVILQKAARKAFPVNLDKGFPSDEAEQEGVDISNFDELWSYISQNFVFMSRRESNSILKLQELAIGAMPGTFAPYSSPAYETIRNLRHTPILFPHLLKEGDILAIYSDEGCAICKFKGYDDHGGVLRYDTQESSDQKTAEKLANDAIRKRFYMKRRTIHLQLSENDGDITYCIDNFMDAYILTKKLDNPALPQ